MRARSLGEPTPVRREVAVLGRFVQSARKYRSCNHGFESHDRVYSRLTLALLGAMNEGIARLARALPACGVFVR